MADLRFYMDAGYGTCPDEGAKHKAKVQRILIEKARQLRESGQARAALQLLEDVASESGEDAALLRERGLAYEQVGEYHLAATNLEQAQLALPADFEALFVLAMVYFRLGRVEESLAILEQLLAYAPELALLHGWKGQCLGYLKRGFEAHCAFLRARELQPDSARLLFQHGQHLLTWRHAEHAAALFERAIALEPNNASAYYELARAYRSLGESRKAVQFSRAALELSPADKIVSSGYLLDLCYQSLLSAEQVADEHRRVCRQQYPDSDVKRPMPLKSAAGRRLRIGYLSADFFMHSVMRFLEPVLKHHDRRRFEIYCYANVKKPDALTQKVQLMDLVWRDIKGLAAQRVADQIKADGIDILVDLSGHTAGNRLDVCGLKPAPVQVSWLGYPHSTGLQQIDWYLSDSWCDPPGMTDHLYVEQVWRLPELFCCYQSPEFSQSSERTASSPFTFGCFNNFSKISDDFLRVWAAILKQVPGSRLYLKSSAIGDAKSQQRIKGVFEQCGISPDRIQCQSFLATFEEHLACYQQVDIALDTFPYHGTTTSCEALWMGVPVVTLAGKTHLSRVGVGLLHAVGLDDLVADSPDEYVTSAVRLAGDKTRLTYLRSSLRGTMERSTLMAHTGFTRQLEEAFVDMYEQAMSND
jgi:predicted O-linked N-acetylglucosamine transferase (SPINDLY family)